MELVKRFLVEETGAETTEWALLVVVLALALLVGGPKLGDALSAALGTIGSKVNTHANTIP